MGGKNAEGKSSTGGPNQTNGRSPPGDHAPCKGSSAGQEHVRRDWPCSGQPEVVRLGAQLLPGATKKSWPLYFHFRYSPSIFTGQCFVTQEKHSKRSYFSMRSLSRRGCFVRRAARCSLRMAPPRRFRLLSFGARYKTRERAETGLL